MEEPLLPTAMVMEGISGHSATWNAAFIGSPVQPTDVAVTYTTWPTPNPGSPLDHMSVFTETYTISRARADRSDRS